MKKFFEKLLQVDNKKLCILIFLLGLIPRFGWFFIKGRYLDISVPAGGDAIGYDQLAVNLVKYHQYAFEVGKPTAYREPVYPYFLAIIYSIFGLSNYTAVRIVQILISSLACVMIFLLSIDLFDKKIAILAGFIGCFWPHFIYYSTTILRETLFCFLLICSVYFFNRIYQGKVDIKNLIISGIFAGIISLINSVSLAFIFLSFIYFFIKKNVKETLILCLIFFLVYSFWIIRNYKVFRTFIPASTVGGFTLYYGTAGDYDMLGTDKEEEYWQKDPVMMEVKKIDDEIESNKFFIKKSLERIKHNPLDFIFRFFKKLIKLYRIVPYRGRYHIVRFHNEKLVLFANIFSFGIILPFFVLSFFLYIKKIKKYLFLYLPIVVFSICYSIIWCVIRYRISIEPYIIILSSSGMIYCCQLLNKFLWKEK